MYKHNARYYYCLGYCEGTKVTEIKTSITHDYMQFCLGLVGLGYDMENPERIERLISIIGLYEMGTRMVLFTILCEIALYTRSETITQHISSYKIDADGLKCKPRLYRNHDLHPLQAIYLARCRCCGKYHG